MQCVSWPYWRDLPNEANTPSAFVTEWPPGITDDQKQFWRLFVSNMITDLKEEVTIVNSNKLDQIINLLNK